MLLGDDDTELLRSARALLDALASARFALGCLLFMGDANLFPKFARGSFLVSPSGKCLEHTRD